MTAMNLIPQIASIVYNASTTLIRFLYVRSSLQVNVQEVYRRNQFTLMFVAIGEGINIINLTSAVYYRQALLGLSLENIQTDARAGSGLPLILYQACLDPWAVFSIPFYRVMPLNQIIVYLCDMVIISSNIFLYRFLKRQTSNNSGKSGLSDS